MIPPHISPSFESAPLSALNYIQKLAQFGALAWFLAILPAHLQAYLCSQLYSAVRVRVMEYQAMLGKFPHPKLAVRVQ